MISVAWAVLILPKNDNIKGEWLILKCKTCTYLYIDLSKKNQIKPINFRYPTCFCRCDYFDKLLSMLTKEVLKNCKHYRERNLAE